MQVAHPTSTRFLQSFYLRSVPCRRPQLRPLLPHQPPSPVVEEEYLYGVSPVVVSDEDVDSFDIYIVETNDVSIHALEGDEGSIGFAKLQTLLDYANAYTDNILLIDAGNTFVRQGYPVEAADYVADALAMLGYDVVVPGGSDYALGFEKLLSIDGEMDHAFLSTNTFYEKSGASPFELYKIFSYNGFDVAVVGLTTPAVKEAYASETSGVGFISDSIVANAQDAIDYLNSIADYVVVASNIGDGWDLSADDIINSISGINLFIDGGNESDEESIRTVGDTLVISSGKNLESVGVVDVKVSMNEISSSAFFVTSEDVLNPGSSALMQANGVSDVPADAGMTELLSTAESELGL